MRDCVVSAEVQANLHAGIPTANDENSLVCETRTGRVHTGVNNSSTKPLNPGDFWYYRLGILAGGDDKPPGNVLGVLSSNSPKPRSGIELGAVNCLVEPGFDLEVGSVGLHVGDELVLGWVLWEIFREAQKWKLTELFGKVELKTIIGLLLPQRSYAITFLKNHRGNAMFRKASRDC